MNPFKVLSMSLPFLILFSTFQAEAQREKTIAIKDNFNTVKIFDGIQTELHKSDKNEVVVTGIDEDDVKAEVDDAVLKIKMNLGNVWSKSNTKVKVYFKDITDIDVNEGASADIMEELKQPVLNLRTQEGANIIGTIDVDELNAKSVSGGHIKLKGSSNEAFARIKTGGTYEADCLITESTETQITAGGLAKVNASEYIKAEVKMGGKVIIHGDPDKIDRKTTLGGKIINR